MTRLLRVLALVLCFPIAAAQSQKDLGLYLFKIPSESSAMLNIDGPDEPLARLYVGDPARLADGLLGSSIEVVSVDADAITVTANTAGTASGDLLERHNQASFVIDFDEPAVMNLRDKLQTMHGERPALNDLLQFTYDAIPEKTYLRDFDVASRVAERGEGDCTEHAVLLSALARGTGRPSRVVIGLLLVQENGTFFSYGHAWGEVFENGRWQVADATMPGISMPEATVRYLPMLVLQDEGPGYSYAMAQLFGLFPSRVDLVKSSAFEREPD